MAIISGSAHPKALNEVNSGIEMIRTDLFNAGESRETNFSRAGIVDLDGVTRYVIAAIYLTGQVDVFDLETGMILRTMKLDCCEITGLAFVPDRKTVAIISSKTLQLWDLQTKQVVYEADLKEDFSGPLAVSPDGVKVFLTNIVEDYVLEFDLQTQESSNLGFNSYAYNFADPFAVENYHFNNLGNLVMLKYDDHKPALEDIVTKTKIVIPFEAKTDSDFVEAFAINSDGKYLAIGTPTDIFVWDLEKLELHSTLSGHEWLGADGWFGKIRSLVFAPYSNLLVSVGWDDTTRSWNIDSASQIRRLNVCCSASFTPDGKYLVTAGDGVIRVWGIP